MRTKLHHPLWTHLPAVVLVALMLVAFLQARPLPDRVPVHFSLSGEPNRWGSPWELLGIYIMALFWVGVSIAGDEAWARHEDRKSFNWVSLLDELLVGFLAGMSFAYFRTLTEGGTHFTMPWGSIVPVAATAVTAAAVLECFRPFRPMPEQVSSEDTGALEAEIAERGASGDRWAYWETQNPRYMAPVIALSAGALLIGAVVSRGDAWWASGLCFGGAVALLLVYGGMRVGVTPDRVQVRTGILGLRLLTLDRAEIAEAEVHSFSPLRDFGGWGIRWNRQMKAYFLSGHRGVKLRTREGKQYLVGSDHPERLAAAIGATLEAAGSPAAD
ncbi:MAG: DUF1648 domain-containing protein [Armatimonadota bacterium]